ncbi:hypothetical protein V6N13_047981 [Hibiscus sabdariffa]
MELQSGNSRWLGSFLDRLPILVRCRRWLRFCGVRIPWLGLVALVHICLFFSFTNASTRVWVLESGPWHIQHKPLVLWRWESNLKRLDFDLGRMLVWVQLFYVPLELYTKVGLSYIASVIGIPLYMDSVTTSRERLQFAKVCIELECGVKIPEHIDVVLQDKSIATIKGVVPWLPPCCVKCTQFGHSENACTKATSKVVQVWKMKEVIVDKEVGESYGGNSVFDEGLADTQQKEPGIVVHHVVAESIERSGKVVRGCELNEQHVMS